MIHDRRMESREGDLAAEAAIYDKDGRFLLSCIVRDLSSTGARIELLKEEALPRFFSLSLAPDGSTRKLCSKIWQLSLMVGLRFIQ